MMSSQLMMELDLATTGCTVILEKSNTVMTTRIENNGESTPKI